MGFAGERGSLIAAEWGNEDRVRASDREFPQFPRSTSHPTDAWTTVHQDGGFTISRNQAGTRFPGVTFPTAPTAGNTQVRVVLREGRNPNNPADYINQNTNTGSCVGATAAGGCTPGSTLHKSSTNQQTDLRTPIDRRAAYLDGIFDITENVSFRTNLLYSHRLTERQVAGYPMQAASFNTPMSAQSYFNPTGQELTTWWRRTWEVPRISDSELTTYRFSGASEGNVDIGERCLDWGVSYLHNSNRVLQSTYGNLNLGRTRLAVGRHSSSRRAGSSA